MNISSETYPTTPPVPPPPPPPPYHPPPDWESFSRVYWSHLVRPSGRGETQIRSSVWKCMIFRIKTSVCSGISILNALNGIYTFPIPRNEAHRLLWLKVKLVFHLIILPPNIDLMIKCGGFQLCSYIYIYIYIWFMGPTWGPPGSCRTQMVPILAHEPCYQGI